MTVSSVIIQAWPNKLPAIKQALTVFSGVELHAETPDGRLIVTVEDTPEMLAADCYIELTRLNGVLSAAVVYEFSGDVAVA
jgi:nitrate reductase NapD